MTYTVIRSARRSIALELRPEGLLVRAPYFVPRAQIERFVRSKADWIERRQKKLEEAQRTLASAKKLSPEELDALVKKAKEVIPQRVACYAPLVGVSYGRITIRCQRTRWGSCSSAGNLNFNCLLMLAPPEVLDSVVVHELCHRKESNHSQRFYAEVLRVFPDYRRCQKWLKDNGAALLARLGP